MRGRRGHVCGDCGGREGRQWKGREIAVEMRGSGGREIGRGERTGRGGEAGKREKD
jgi:hypothetical protein